jgi:hypothetical protein
MVMGLGTCACLLVCLAGCPDKQKTTVQQNPGPPQVITKVELERVREDFVAKLNPAGHPPVTQSTPSSKEFVLVDFRDNQDHARANLLEVKRRVEHLVRAKSPVAKIFDDQFGEWKFSFKYEVGKVHGHVTGSLSVRPHPQQLREHWDLELKVKEEVW